jgi:hypothetical protein
VQRLLIWSGVEGWLAEAAGLELGEAGLSARGTQLGVDPVPYRLDYRLDASVGWVTRSLEVEAAGEGWRRRLALARDGDGTWRCEAAAEGEVELPPPGGRLAGLDEALDCDLGLSPLTNLMPVRRAGLERGPGALDIVAAWVSSPDLSLHVSAQRYEHVRREGGGAVVRYADRGAHDGFVADLVLDADGLVLEYPGLARRQGR